MTRKHRLILFSILSLLVLCFIFSNSLQSREESSARSSGIADFLRPLLDLFEWMTDDQFHHFIRKLAHFTEFAALGFCLFGVACNIPLTGKRRLWMPALASASAAVTDETIQYFTGRACIVRDMLLDTAGAVFGIIFAAAVVWLWRRRK